MFYRKKLGYRKPGSSKMSISFIKKGEGEDEREGQIKRIDFLNNGANEHLVIKNLIWENIPNFAVITGKNGVGKTQFLRQLWNVHNPERKKKVVFRDVSYSQHISDVSNNPDIFQLLNNSNKNDFVQSFKEYAITEDVNVLGSLIHFNVGKDLKEKIDSGEYDNLNDESFADKVSKMIDSYPLNYDMRDHISNPVSILNQVFQLFDKRSKIHQHEYRDFSKSEVLFNFFCKEKNITIENVGSYKNFHKKLTNPMFIEKLIKKYVEKELKVEHPCEEINKLLIKYKFPYQLLWETRNDGRKEIRFIRDSNKGFVSFSELSSGEKVILDLLAWLFYFKGLSAEENKKLDITRTNLMLLDEPDSHLDPTNLEIFFDIVYDEFVKAFNIQVLMTTHRMDTVKLAPEKSVFIMENGYEIRCNKEVALSRMNSCTSFKLVNSREANSSLSDGKLVIQPNVNYVLVENENDAKFYSIVYHKLLQIKKLEKNSAQIIFTPVGIKVYRPEVLDALAKGFSNLKVNHDLPDVQEYKALVNSLKCKNDVGGGCSNVKKKVVIEVYNCEISDEKLGTVKDVRKQKIRDPPVMHWGLIDKDKGNKPKNSLHVIDVYSFENYLCMPLNLFYLFCEEKDRYEEFRTKKELIEQLLKKDEVSTQVIENKRIETTSQENPSQEIAKNLNDLVIDCASKAIEALLEKITERKKVVNKEKKALEELELSLGSTDNKKNINLVNNIKIQCPSIFFEGLNYSINGENKSANGHNLMEVITYIMYGKIDKSSDKHFFDALCSLPANLLPENILTSMNNLATSKLFKNDFEKKRKQNEELCPTYKKSLKNF